MVQWRMPKTLEYNPRSAEVHGFSEIFHVHQTRFPAYILGLGHHSLFHRICYLPELGAKIRYPTSHIVYDHQILARKYHTDHLNICRPLK